MLKAMTDAPSFKRLVAHLIQAFNLGPIVKSSVPNPLDLSSVPSAVLAAYKDSVVSFLRGTEDAFAILVGNAVAINSLFASSLESVDLAVLATLVEMMTPIEISSQFAVFVAIYPEIEVSLHWCRGLCAFQVLKFKFQIQDWPLPLFHTRLPDLIRLHAFTYLTAQSRQALNDAYLERIRVSCIYIYIYNMYVYIHVYYMYRTNIYSEHCVG
jgi:hypothetical protein